MSPTTGGTSHATALWVLLIALALSGCPPTGEPPPFAPMGEGGGDDGCADLDGDGYVTAEGCALPAGDCAPEDPARHPEAPEICNLIDDNCNRATDEGNPGGDMACDTGLDGICAVGRTACMQGEVQCEQVDDRAPRESCNGQDDDCDGTVDEAPDDIGGACNTGLDGRCSAGTEACTNGAVGCVPDEGAITEQCNGEDDDCDGEVDEANPGGGSDCNTELPGECAAGVEVCDSGGLICQGRFERREELCDGLDDDCDGSTDEAFADLGDACVVGEGACRREGTRVCAADGSGTECGIAPGMQIVELCNGEDDDCDGSIDEDFAALGEACEVGVGACAAPGTVACGPDGAGTICDGEPGQPAAEACNGEDDDCDGVIDNGFELGAACQGDDVCASPGVTVCGDDGAGVICQVDNVVQPVDETCDGADNDCDGRTDEAFPTLGEGCMAGLGICARAGILICAPDGSDVVCDGVPGPPDAVEACNDLDDDCDGRVDNGAECPGPLGAAVRVYRIAEFAADDCGRDFTGDAVPDNALGALAGDVNPRLADAFGPDGARAIVLRFLGVDGMAPVTLEVLEAARTADGPVPTARVIDAAGAALESLPGLVPGNLTLINPEPGGRLSIPSPLFSSASADPALTAASFLRVEQLVFDGERDGLTVPNARISGLVHRQGLLDAYAAAETACAALDPVPTECAVFAQTSAAALAANLAADATLGDEPAVSICLVLATDPANTLPVGGQACVADDDCYAGLVCRAAPVIADPALGGALARRCGPAGEGGLADGAACARDADCIHGLCVTAQAGGARCASLCAADAECATGVCRGVQIALPEATTPGGLTAGVCLDIPGSGAACETACDDDEICGPWFAGGLATPGEAVIVEGRCQAADPAGAGIGETCADAFDCAHGNGCVPDLEGVLRCAAPCVAADACPDDTRCIPTEALPAIGAAPTLLHGACLPIPASVGSGRACTADRDCPGEETCRAAALPGGDLTRYCARGEGFFTVGQPCDQDADCASGRCQAGICGGLCADDDDCLSRMRCAVDARVDDRGAVLGGECQPPSGACLRDIDCNAVAGCADGRCVCSDRQCVRGCRYPSACADGLHCRSDNVCAPFCRDDEAEPNDDQATATLLPLGRANSRIDQVAQLCDGSAIDWYRLTAPGLPFRFTLAALTDDVALDVRLIDAFGAPVIEASVDDGEHTLLVDDPAVLAQVAGQLVYLVVRGSGIDGGAEYSLLAELNAPDCPDPAVEPRDNPWEYTELLTDPAANASERVEGWICPQDTDWYAINLMGGDRLTVDVTIDGNAVDLPADLRVQLEGPDHIQLQTAQVQASQEGDGQLVFEVPAYACVDQFCEVGGVRTQIFCADTVELCSSMPWFLRVEGLTPDTQSAYRLDVQVARADAALRCVPDSFEPDVIFSDPDRVWAALGPQSVEPVQAVPGAGTFPYLEWQIMEARACGGEGGVAVATDVDRVLMMLQGGDRIELELSQQGAQRLQIDWYAQQLNNDIIQDRFEVSVQPVYTAVYDPGFDGGAPFINGRYYGFGIVRGGNDGGAYEYSVPYTARFRRVPGDFVPDRDCAEPESLALVFGQDTKQGDTRGADDDHRPGVCVGGTGGDRVYRGVVPFGAAGELVATVTSADGEAGDFGVSIRTACAEANTELDCNEDDLTAVDPRRRARARARLEGGSEVFIIVDSFSPAHEGRYTLEVQWNRD